MINVFSLPTAVPICNDYTIIVAYRAVNTSISAKMSDNEVTDNILNETKMLKIYGKTASQWETFRVKLSLGGQQ